MDRTRPSNLPRRIRSPKFPSDCENRTSSTCPASVRIWDRAARTRNTSPAHRRVVLPNDAVSVTAGCAATLPHLPTDIFGPSRSPEMANSTPANHPEYIRRRIAMDWQSYLNALPLPVHLSPDNFAGNALDFPSQCLLHHCLYLEYPVRYAVKA